MKVDLILLICIYCLLGIQYYFVII